MKNLIKKKKHTYYEMNNTKKSVILTLSLFALSLILIILGLIIPALTNMIYVITAVYVLAAALFIGKTFIEFQNDLGP